ncbi:membrane protein, putative [Nitrosococcus oceani ATCC 19707]|uniref:Membrane protein, putative n=2 Tax=Nitrosococcus oceani TaxID=1229 RepID=Q3JB80_NITOC|nr:DUF6629 family protein [Nitrosococcus oceani]ABA57916.1 membrane protein, putative [Nitrosococcus oceani ATCC 19707]EDZ66981.1 hypothetical protein NOC27_308 [Nitrosococcus oceani AFC27]KFI19644.1 hypothetical protein IB75_07465 [Nitrosococcus oceani C-27]GEM19559.1 hypothetical protein NONS58_09510 [Nitrosococcus oceani]
MCFSATANFAGGAVIATVGIATLLRVKHTNEVLFAALPLLFALHQIIEGFVWLGLDGKLSPAVLNGMGAAFMLYAQGLLPILMPLSVWLIEPGQNQRQRILPFMVIGIALALYILWALTAFDTRIFQSENSIVYLNEGTNYTTVAVVYVIATCGPLFLSGYSYLIGLGVANLLGILEVMYFKAEAFTSLWCLYAAIVSVLIYGHFHRRRAAENAYKVGA